MNKIIFFLIFLIYLTSVSAQSVDTINISNIFSNIFDSLIKAFLPYEDKIKFEFKRLDQIVIKMSRGIIYIFKLIVFYI